MSQVKDRYVPEENRYELINPRTTLEIEDYRLFDSRRTTIDTLINKLAHAKFTQVQLNEIAGSMANIKPEIAKIAIEKGAVLEKPYSLDHKTTLFHHIVSTANLDLIEFAILNKADINHECNGTRPIEVIFTHLGPREKSPTGSTDLDVIDLLLRYNADPSLVDRIVEKYFSPYFSRTYNGRDKEDVLAFRNLLDKYTNGKYGKKEYIDNSYDTLDKQRMKIEEAERAQRAAYNDRLLKEVLSGNFY